MSDPVARAAVVLPLTVGIATVPSTSHDQSTAGAERLSELLEADGHTVISRIVLPAQRDALDAQLGAWCSHAAIDTVMVLGGIGLSARDVTTEAVSAVVVREAVGFGEEVRRLCRPVQPLGALSLRAMAGVAQSAIVFALPESARLIDAIYSPLLGPLCDASQPGSLAALVPSLRAID